MEKSVKSYISNGYNGVLLIDQYDPQVGLSNIKIELVQKNLSCSFTRENILLVNNYFPLNIDYPPYLLVAYGSGIWKIIRLFCKSKNKIPFYCV